MSFWSRVRDTAKAVVKAVRNPGSYAPPPLPTTPPPAPRPAPRPAPPREREAPRQVSRPVRRSELPASWGANKAGLWIDATKSEPRLARDENAQRFYDAALYSFSESREVNHQNLMNFKEFIEDEYGIDWDDIFDWEDWRENYDAAHS